MVRGKLYLIPSSLSNSPTSNVFPDFNEEIVQSLNEFIVEELKTARRFLRRTGYSKSFDEVTFHLLNEHTDVTHIQTYLDSVNKGKDIGLLSEAGSPCIADPGSEIVRIAHSLNIQVVPLVGPSSILLALIASGFNGQNFVFNGYLPRDKRERVNKIKELERNAVRFNQTQIFMETPYRNKQMFDSLVNTCSSTTSLCIACNLTSEEEYISTKTIRDWKKEVPDIHKKPAVFLIYS